MMSRFGLLYQKIIKNNHNQGNKKGGGHVLE